MAEPGLWLCPGNLFTNQLERPEAIAQSCVPASPSRLSQGQSPLKVDAVASPVAPTEAAQVLPVIAVTSQSAMAADPVAVPLASAATATARAGVARQPVQSRRDDDTLQILRTELARTQAQLQALGLRANDPQNTAAVHRLRGDEAALLRELARLGR